MSARKKIISDHFARFSGLKKRKSQQEIQSKVEIYLAE